MHALGRERCLARIQKAGAEGSGGEPVTQQPLSQADVAAYLSMLSNTIENDIRPLLRTAGGAPHAVAREVFSYIDHLGSLSAGRTSERGMSRAACSYITTFMAKVDQVYLSWGIVMYTMYRHGTVHNFQPQTVTNGGEILTWAEYPGERDQDVIFPDNGERLVIHHGHPYRRTNEQIWRLPVSTLCLVEDLKTSLDMFKAAVGKDQALFGRVTMYLSYLRTPRPVSFTLP